MHVASRTTLENVRDRYPDDHLYEFAVEHALGAGASEVDDTLENDDAADHAMVKPGSETKKERFAKAMMKVALRVWPPPAVIAATGAPPPAVTPPAVTEPAVEPPSVGATEVAREDSYGFTPAGGEPPS